MMHLDYYYLDLLDNINNYSNKQGFIENVIDRFIFRYVF